MPNNSIYKSGNKPTNLKWYLAATGWGSTRLSAGDLLSVEMMYPTNFVVVVNGPRVMRLGETLRLTLDWDDRGAYVSNNDVALGMISYVSWAVDGVAQRSSLSLIKSGLTLGTHRIDVRFSDFWGR